MQVTSISFDKHNYRYLNSKLLRENISYFINEIIMECDNIHINDISKLMSLQKEIEKLKMEFVESESSYKCLFELPGLPLNHAITNTSLSLKFTIPASMINIDRLNVFYEGLISGSELILDVEILKCFQIVNYNIHNSHVNCCFVFSTHEDKFEFEDKFGEFIY